MKLHYSHYLNKYAQNLRKAGNLTEVILWQELKSKKLGVRFVRQRPIGNYIVDFYCYAFRLAIEIDGSTHDMKLEKDAEREKDMKMHGVRFLRFTDNEVRYNLAGVVTMIQECVRNPSPPKKAVPRTEAVHLSHSRTNAQGLAKLQVFASHPFVKGE
ncbi:MAG: DUF559 domain-containing protein [bacterium]|nr:DUF559 domain-containing protein [bacterium]